MQVKQLYNQADIKKERSLRLAKQKGKDALTGLLLDAKDAVLDHDHDTQLCRGAIHRQTNTFLGKVENSYKRMMEWWYPGTLLDLLGRCVQYLEVQQKDTTLHPAWIKKSMTAFRKLTADEQKELLKRFWQPQGKNGKQREAIFKKLLQSKAVLYSEVLDEIEHIRMITKLGTIAL